MFKVMHRGVVIQRGVFAQFFRMLRSVAAARYPSAFALASSYVELRRFAAKNLQTVENDRERVVPFRSRKNLTRARLDLSAPLIIPRCAAPDAAVPLGTDKQRRVNGAIWRIFCKSAYHFANQHFPSSGRAAWESAGKSSG